MKGTMIIDCFPESADRYRDQYAIVVVDVIRATTTATTAVSLGRRVFPVRDSNDAFILAASLKNPLMVGELGGNMPYGFDFTNSPAQLATRTDIQRPMILVSSSGTQLMLKAEGSEGVYIGCLRNISALAQYLDGRHSRIAILGAGSRGEFRREDQMGCAWVADKLVEAGYFPESEKTQDYITRWRGVDPGAIRTGKSAQYLIRSGQEEDLNFILSHVDDLDVIPSLTKGELTVLSGRVETVSSQD